MFFNQVKLAWTFREVESFIFDHFLGTYVIRIDPFTEPGVVNLCRYL